MESEVELSGLVVIMVLSRKLCVYSLDMLYHLLCDHHCISSLVSAGLPSFVDLHTVQLTLWYQAVCMLQRSVQGTIPK